MRRGHAVKGRVYDEASGVGIAAASVNFRESQVDRFAANWRIRDSFAVRSEKSGSFVLEGVPSGRITISAGIDGCAGRGVEIIVGDERRQLRSRCWSVVRSAADSRPRQRRCARRSAGLFRLDERFGGSSRTTQSGDFWYQSLPAGATGPPARQRRDRRREITLAASERVEGIVLALGAGHSIRGVVTGLVRKLSSTSTSVGQSRRRRRAASPIRVDARGTYDCAAYRPGA